jgi:hypothetical protein
MQFGGRLWHQVHRTGFGQFYLDTRTGFGCVTQLGWGGVLLDVNVGFNFGRYPGGGLIACQREGF